MFVLTPEPQSRRTILPQGESVTFPMWLTTSGEPGGGSIPITKTKIWTHPSGRHGQAFHANEPAVNRGVEKH
ncbi:hypothetical protein AAFF_G00004400 [Aldrovandia affinis]|uniref:Uncharacterized protein n=1 Tax=Aldrovandia affinis TaxID=143900 RepID=A0AAD7TFB1_9TELE|nr:hypothetical protein AAFF_G00004400 [Aldrovandia affinis]